MPETATSWPYDAIEDDPLTKLRIPVTNSYPGWYYTVALDAVPITTFDKVPMGRPDEKEAAQLVSYLAFHLSDLRPSYVDQLRARPFDIGVNNATRIFRKWGENDWGYRLSSWEYGPTYIPEAPAFRERRKTRGGDMAPASLVKVMDRAQHSLPGAEFPDRRWLAWKAAHPEVFGDA